MHEGGGFRSDPQAGMLYVEILVALFILSMALLSMVPLLVTAAHENGAARDLTFATAAAQDKAEELKVVDVASLADGTELLAHEAITYTRSWVVQDDVPAPGMRAVTVTVTSHRKNTYGGVRPAEVIFYRRD